MKTLFKRGSDALCFFAILLGLVAGYPAQANAAAYTLQYLQIPGPYFPAANSGISSGAIYNLPGYGNVKVTWASPSGAALPTTSAQDTVLAHNQQSSGGTDTYNWAADTQDISFLNNPDNDYVVTFTFLNGQPVMNRLILVVAALASGTTATVSQSGTFEGEYQLQFSPPPPSSPSVFTAGTTFSSGYASPLTNSGNTGWALYKTSATLPLTGGNPTLDVTVHQIPGDGIGFTLGYVVEEREGLLKICKVAGRGVAVGTPFSFTIDSATVQIPSGPAPDGYCSVVSGYQVGTNLTIGETVSAGYGVSNIAVRPPSRAVGQPNPATGSATVTIGDGVTEVTYTNVTRGKGYLEICKFGWNGVQGDFNFSVSPGGPNSVTVPANACSPPFEVQSGQIEIRETPVAGTTLGFCATWPNDRQVGTCTGQTLTVNVVPGGISTQTVAAFLNMPAQDHAAPNLRTAPSEALPRWLKKSR